MPDPGLDRASQLGLRLVVAVQVDPPGLEARPERHVQLAARGDVDREPLLAQHPVGGGERGRLARVDDLEVGHAGREGIQVGAGAGADVVLGVDVGGGAELARQLDHVAAADLEVAGRVHAAAQRVHRRALDRVCVRGRRHRAGHYPRMARTHRPPMPPSESGVHGGRPYLTWLPAARPPWPGMVIVHGAGSQKENHGDFGRACAAAGWAALAYDQRGHGESADEMSPEALADVGRMARLPGRTRGRRPRADLRPRLEHGRASSRSTAPRPRTRSPP